MSPLKTFFTIFILAYIIISLPAMLGVGYIIDWVPEATLLQKLKGYVIDGLTMSFVLKAAVTTVIAAVGSFIVYKKQKQN